MIIPLLKVIPKDTYNDPNMMFGPFPQMKNEDLEEDQIDSGYDVPENMTLEQYILYISYIHLKSCCLTQESHFQLFA